MCTLLKWAASRRDGYLVCFVERSSPGVWVKADACPPESPHPLHLAAASGGGAVVRTLLALGVDHNLRDEAGRTALHYAANSTGKTLVFDVMKVMNAYNANTAKILFIHLNNRSIPVTFELLHAGANVSSASSSGETPLHLAVRRLSGAQALELLASGADRGAVNAAGETPFSLATETHADFAGYLLGEYSVQTTYPVERCTPGEGFIPQLGITRDHLRSPRNVTDWCGRSPLYWFVAQMTDDIIPPELISEVDAADILGRTALHEAARLGKSQAVRSLTEAGASLNASDWLGQTPLHLAELCQRADTAEVLRRVGASVDATDKRGRTPADLALTATAPKDNIINLL